MEKNLEKSLKRYLKRKVKISLGFIVAFLLSCNFVSAEGLYIKNNSDTNEIEFSKDNGIWGENPYGENSFKDSIYTNNIELKTNRVSLVNSTNGISLINNGGIIVDSNDSAWGIDNSRNINKLKNNGIIEVKGKNETTGIGNYGGTIENLINDGIIKIENPRGYSWGILAMDYSNIKQIENNGIIEVKGNESKGICFYDSTGEGIINNGEIFVTSNSSGTALYYDNSSTDSILNNGVINISPIDKQVGSNNYFAGIQYSSNSDTTGKIEINNTGTIKNYAEGQLNTKGILYSSKVSNSLIENKGNIIVNSGNEALGISLSSASLGNLKNNGMIYANGTHQDTSALYFGYNSNINDLENNGIMASNNSVIKNSDTTKLKEIVNNGLFVGELDQNLENRVDEFNKGFIFEVKDGKYKEINRAENSGNIINATLNGNGETGTQSITFENQNQKGKIYNGITDTLVVKDKNSLTNSTVNGYTNAVVFDKAGGELTLDKSIINGGIAENSFAIKGQSGNDILYLSNESIINGNINLGEGNDNINIDNTVQLNGTLDGGTGDKDTLTFNSSVTKSSSDKNINILYNITGFENTTVGTKVTLFEKTISDNGEIKNLTAQLGNITIAKNGELTLRVDGTEKDTEGKVTGHALYGNKGSITAENGGKLTLNTFGFGEAEVISFKDTDLSKLKDEDINLSSALHDSEIGENNTITVSAKKDLEDLDVANYEKLNKIYHSILNSKNLDKFTVSEEQYGAFTKYLHDIYAANPYAYSSELSRKTMSMMKNLADKDLNPELNKWAIYGGLTHTDDGTENSYYGKGYYTYDIGSRDISADTKISGGYFKAEYGKANDLTTGIIFGGNNSETEIGASKVEGDSFYFGTYAKKYINNFRFTLGAGFEHGDYKADRTAIGYDGITETRKYDSNYHDRGFNIYADTKYTKELGNGFYFEPSVTLEYSYVDQDGAKEDGVLAIETDSKNFDYLSGTINLDLRKEIKKDKFTHSLTAGVSYERMLSGYDEEYITGRIKGGTNFDILVPEKEKDIFSLNAKYELETEKGFIFDVKGSYRFEHDTDKDEWTVGTGIGYKF